MVAESNPVLDAGVSIRPLSRREYDVLVERGVFGEERLELIRGLIVRMNPQGSQHAASIRRLTKLLVLALGDRADVRPQLSLAVSDDSEPEPDVAVTMPGDEFRAHPETALLVIEVANSSHRLDRGIKAELYAQAHVREYWIVDVVGGVVEVYREPNEERPVRDDDDRGARDDAAFARVPRRRRRRQRDLAAGLTRTQASSLSSRA